MYIYIYMCVCVYSIQQEINFFSKSLSQLHIYINCIYFCIKTVINTNCLSTGDPFLLNKKDSQSVISNI